MGYRINDLIETTSVTASDELELQLAGGGSSRRATVGNLVGSSNAATLAALKARTDQNGIVYLVGRLTVGDGGEGMFRWDSSDLSAEVTADTQSGIYVAPNSDATGASGAWVRQHSGMINVRWFGADNSGTTDCSPAIQGAIDFAYSSVVIPDSPEVITTNSPSASVYIPTGSYRIYTQIVIPSYVNVLGDGKFCTTLRSYITDSSAVLKLTPEGTVAPTFHSFHSAVESLSIDGRNQECIGIWVYRTHRFILRDIFIGETTSSGIYFYESYIGDIFSPLIRECGDVTRAAVVLSGPDANNGSHAINFFGGEIINSFGDGLIFEYALSSGCFGTTIEGCQNGTGVIMRSTSCFLIGCYLELNKHHVELDAVALSLNNNFFSHLHDKSITATTATTDGSSTILIDTTGLEVYDHLDIEGETYTLSITSIIDASSATVHRAAETTGTFAVSISNAPILATSVTGATISNNYMPPCKTDIGIIYLGSSLTLSTVENNKAFGSKDGIIVDPLLVDGSNNMPIWTGTAYANEQSSGFTGSVSFSESVECSGGVDFGALGLITKYDSVTGELQLLRGGVVYYAVSGVGNRFYEDVRLEGTNNTAVFASLTTYADNAAAVTAGLTAGYLYKTATGEVRIVV